MLTASTSRCHSCPGQNERHRCLGIQLSAAIAQRAVARPHIAICHASSAPTTDTPDGTADSRPRRTRRVALFTSDGPKEQQHQSTAAEPQQQHSEQVAPVSDEFRRVFESLGAPKARPKKTRRQGQPAVEQELTDQQAPSSSRQQQCQQADVDGTSSSSSRQDRDSKIDRFREWGRPSETTPSAPPRSSSSRNSSRSIKGPHWSGRGHHSGRDEPDTFSSSSSSRTANGRRLTPEEQRQRWEEEAEERERMLEDQERRRLIRKERSERLPTKPKPKADKVIFQAMTREWDEKTTAEERRGARAAARKVATLGLYDRNKTVRKLRQKYVSGRIDEEADPEAKKVAQRAVEQVQEAAAKSIQKPKEVLYQEAQGVKRSFARAEALPEGEWERLKTQYKALDQQIKIGRKGCTPALVSAIQNFWRGREVVKLRIHDEKSARKVIFVGDPAVMPTWMNLPRFNLLLQELEEMSGGVLIDVAGASIWLYRGPDWQPPPVTPPYQPPAAAEHFTQQHTPRGKWLNMGGISCYIVSSSDTADMPSAAVDSSSGIGQAATLAAAGGSGDVMTVLFLPDQFPFKDQPVMMQIADRVAAKGCYVVMPDLLGPSPNAPHSAVSTAGKTEGQKPGAGYWLMHRWPVVRRRKLEHMEWFQTGAGSWLHQRPRLLQLLEAMQQRGLYDPNAPDHGAAVASAAATATGGSTAAAPQQQQGSGRPLGILGFSWGSHAALRAGGDGDCVAAGVKAVAAMSPMTFQKDVEIATNLKVPVCLLPAKYDPMDQMMLTIDLLQRQYAPRCIFKRFGKVKPGWANWLPQWSDKRAMYQAAEQLLLSLAFLQRELLGNTAASALLPPPLPSTVRTAEEQEAAMKAAAAADAAGDDESAEGDEGDE